MRTLISDIYMGTLNYRVGTNELKSTSSSMICTLFTGHPVRRVFLCVTVMSIS